MDAERWKQIDDLLQSVLHVPPDRQEEFLLQSCAGDASLLEEVQSLLSAHREAGSFLEQPIVNMSAAAETVADVGSPSGSLATMEGQQVSHYKVENQLGSGGMGVVYLAEDVLLGRRVALKFLPGELASDRLAFDRMQREARAASALDHPNICSIYELGEHQGRPFIVMQLLEGQTLRDWIETTSTPIQDPTARLLNAVDFAIEVADGLRAAHQKGIIHRDIKPANIFITNRGDAKILDFGLAKLLEETSTTEALTGTEVNPDVADHGKLHLTRTGTTMGTAYYMSPEQVRGEKLDTRTDLFSLGLVLYEMVTGQRAFAGETGPAVYDAILRRAPTPARQLNPAVSPQLERIIDKALEKDREQRYRSAQEIADDLEQFRGDFRLGVARWSRKWWKRKWMSVAAGVIFFAALVVLGVLIQRSSRGPSSHDSVAPAKARQSVAVLGFRNLSNDANEDWISTALAEMVSTELAAGQQLRLIPGENVARMKLDLELPLAGGYGPGTLKKIRTNLGSDIVIQGSYLASPGNNLRIDLKMQEAHAGETIATVSESGGEAQIAELVSRAGASLREQLGIAAVTAGDLDKTRSALPSDPQAVRLYSEGLAKLRVFDALAAKDLLVRAIAVDPNHAMSHSLLAESLSALGYDAAAAVEAKKAFELARSLPRDNQLLVEGRYRELSNNFPAAIEAYRTLWKYFPDDLDDGIRLAIAQITASLSNDALQTIAQLRTLPDPIGSDPRIDLAEASARESLGDFKRSQQVASAAAEKARAQGSRLLVARAKEREGWAWDRLGNVDKAAAAFSESKDLSSSGGNLRAAATALNGMGNARYNKGDLEGARASYEEARGIARQIGAQRIIGATTNNIGNVFYDQGKLVEARGAYQQALDIDRLIDDKRGIASALGSVANVLQGLGDLPAATRMQEEALQAFRNVGDRRGEASTLNNLGDVLAERGELASAKVRFEDAMKVQLQIGYRRGRGYSLAGVADVLEAQDHLPEARAATKEAIELRKELKDDSGLAQSQMQMARIALEQGETAEAERLARGAAEQFDQQKASGNGCVSNATLGRALLAQGRLKEAETATNLALVLCGRGQERGAKFDATIADAEVKSKSGRAAEAEALATLESVRSEASRGGYVSYELESRLVMGEIEIASGKGAAGRSWLARLQKDAQSKDFAFIARRAKEAINQH